MPRGFLSEIIRRYYQALEKVVKDDSCQNEAYKIELIMKQAKISQKDRVVVPAAVNLAKETDAPAAALELPNGKIILGKTKELLGASAAVLLNAVKELGGIDHSIDLISPESIAPIQELRSATSAASTRDCTPMRFLSPSPPVPLPMTMQGSP